ncbi:MAG: GAF domain-containing protein [Phycisphaerae bacterium]|jgi:putative methionine-R-sulfoxide reductase with GAF domain
MFKRDYERIAAGLSLAGDRQERMQAAVDALWAGLKAASVSWVGFYLPEGEEGLVLGPRRDKPACSPIGLHGVCGQAYLQRRPIVVRDVRELGESYVACDPRDLAEVVVPLLDEAGDCWAVLDLDSHEVGAFSDADVSGLQTVLRAADLTA